MPRRAKRTDQSRTDVITVRVTPAERAEVARKAQASGLTVSNWCALVLTDGKLAVESAPSASRSDPALVAELKRIGNNINQIAAALNSGKSATTREVALAMRDLLDALLRDEVMASRVSAFEASKDSPDGASPS